MLRFRFSIGGLLLIGILMSFSQAATIQSKSCALSDVQDALDAASSGDIISLPAGSAKWSGSLTIGKNRITIQGKGVGSTIISGSGMLFITRGEAANYLRITGLEIRGCKQCIYAFGNGTPREAIKNFRFDNCKFVDTYITLETDGGATGVIDHNQFVNSFAARLYGNNDANAKFPHKLGTSDAIFVEDNIVTVPSNGTAPHFIASNSNSKYVVRHNTFNYAKSLWDIIDAHGYCELPGRGSATWEIYNNEFTICPYIHRVMNLRGGQGVVYNNTFLNYKPSQAITLTDYASCNPPCVQNCSSYPCKDQINNSYFWNNKIGDSPVDPVSTCNSVKVNRDYFVTPMPNYTPYTYPHPLTVNVIGKTTSVDSKNKAESGIMFKVAANPLNPLTMVSYNLPHGTSVHIAIYNAKGERITTLVNKTESAGAHSITWNSSNLPKGLYFMKTNIGNFTNSYKLVR